MPANAINYYSDSVPTKVGQPFMVGAFLNESAYWIYSYHMRLDYNPDILKIDRVIQGNIFGNINSTFNVTQEPGKIIVDEVGGNKTLFNGNLFTVYFIGLTNNEKTDIILKEYWVNRVSDDTWIPQIYQSVRIGQRPFLDVDEDGKIDIRDIINIIDFMRR